VNLSQADRVVSIARTIKQRANTGELTCSPGPSPSGWAWGSYPMPTSGSYSILWYVASAFVMGFQYRRPAIWYEQALGTPRRSRPTGGDRTSAAAERAKAAEDRLKATEERALAAYDRIRAAFDRAQAAIDRAASETDELTHTRRRGPGMEQLQREVDRARRTRETLVVAFVDVDGLKQVNDTRGHLAGDALLVAVADALHECLRSYDLVIRFGGDEFVCALSNTDLADARTRVAEVSDALARTHAGGSITVGLAALGDEHTAEALLHRADGNLLARRAGC
jgi:diguanylate cyclase (GGDEF)-like protein